MLRVVIIFPILAALLVLGLGIGENIKHQDEPKVVDRTGVHIASTMECFDKAVNRIPCDKTEKKKD